MEVLVNPDGTRNRAYRPYIDQEETTRNTMLWDPTRPIHYELYDRTQPPCYPWAAYFKKYRPPGPVSSVINHRKYYYFPANDPAHNQPLWG